MTAIRLRSCDLFFLSVCVMNPFLQPFLFSSGNQEQSSPENLRKGPALSVSGKSAFIQRNILPLLESVLTIHIREINAHDKSLKLLSYIVIQ